MSFQKKKRCSARPGERCCVFGSAENGSPAWNVTQTTDHGKKAGESELGRKPGEQEIEAESGGQTLPAE